ncbi:uncharacterized protein LOC117132712 [Brassica rapa]|uniref:uncharacterized protein LOC117132712 n=1 Tax=Brassica campestris TaxID=3711 RepID=UPI00142D2FE2|nr:uncharacterized protein LOC117132712 [Brassica rapa]
MEHIASCRKALSQWRRQNNVNSAKLVEELKEKVEGLYLNDDATIEEISEALKELCTALKAEEMFWRQKSRVLWLREVDRNSKYFHALVKQRRARNRITQLLDGNGNMVDDEEGLVVIATSYFRQIFESSNPEDVAETLSEVPTTITGPINADLTAPVTEWEVLPQRISETQSAFVAGRQITDNIMIAREMFHALRTKPGGRVKRMAIKTDMSKAYDRMEWSFIEAVMRKMSFSEMWIDWIMRCITSVKYKVLMNGEPRGNNVPGRCLRQGDPLSPFIFILCTEALVSLLNQAENQGKITGMRAARACPSVSHLLFTDDSIFFYKAEPRECEEVMKVVRKYEKASGQRINFDKSSLLFGKRVPANDRQQIKDTLGIQNKGGMGSYLGISEDISGSKCKLFSFLKEKLLHRVNGWTGRWLSKGGKEFLIKSILLDLPTYVICSFLLPLEICENLASAIAQFWWSSNPPKRGVHWAKWEKMCAPREEGGIGFRMIYEFNLTLLAKQLWRLVQFPDSLVARVLRGRYYRLSSPLRIGTADTPSYVWTSITAARKLLLLGIRSKVHSGYGINVWEDLWIPSTPARPARARV